MFDLYEKFWIADGVVGGWRVYDWKCGEMLDLWNGIDGG